MTDQTPPDAFAQGKAAATKGEPLIENPYDETLPAYETGTKAGGACVKTMATSTRLPRNRPGATMA